MLFVFLFLSCKSSLLFCVLDFYQIWFEYICFHSVDVHMSLILMKCNFFPAKPRSWRFASVFSSKSFTILVLALRSLSHLEVIFMYGVRWGGPTSFFGMWISSSPSTICWGDYSFPHWILVPALRTLRKSCLLWFSLHCGFLLSLAIWSAHWGQEEGTKFWVPYEVGHRGIQTLWVY